MPKKVITQIYTDGACSGNPGPGGWGTIIYFQNNGIHELGGGNPQTTNNRMEMQAAIAGLEFLLNTSQTAPVSLHTDSEYVLKGITQWIQGWKKRGWKNASKKPVLNRDLWEILDNLHQRANQQLEQPISWIYVRGHSGNIGNERCDTIARAFASGHAVQLQQI